MIRRLIAGGVTIATALLCSMIITGTADAATGAVIVTQQDSSGHIQCIHMYPAILTGTKTIHELPCNSTVTLALVSSTEEPDVTVVDHGITLTFFGLEYFYMYPDGFDIIEHSGLLA
jgi:hypothetical protein